MTICHEEIIELVEKMPAFPQAVTNILQLTSKMDCAPKDLVKVIEHDPVMTAKILKLVNSAFYGFPNPIGSINHAVVYLGINTVKNLSISIAAMGMLPKKNDSDFDMSEFLLHSLGVAFVAKDLAAKLGVSTRDDSDYFIAGILHDFGKVVFAQFKPQKFRQALDLAKEKNVSLHRAEKKVLGVDHAEVGALLAESWKLSGALIDSIRYHHKPNAKNELMIDVMFAANQIIHFYAFGNSGHKVVTEFPSSVKTRFGFDLEGLIEELGDLKDDMDQARSFVSH